MTGRILDSFPQTQELSVRCVRLGLRAKIYSGGTPTKSNLDYWTDGDLPWIGSGEVNQRLITKPTAHITERAVRNSATKLFPAGSIAIGLAGQGKTKATVAEMGIEAYANQSLACIRDFHGSSRFLFWWLASLYREIRALASQDTRDGLNQSMIGQLPVPDYPLESQAAIAHCLDRETSRIDQLIEKKQRLVELLDEKRTALITAAVTGRIDLEDGSKRTLELSKEVGIPWLDLNNNAFPYRKLSHVASLKARVGWQALRADEFVDEGPYCVTGTDFKDGTINWDSTYHVSEQRYDMDKNIQLKQGDLLITKDGTIGKVAVVPELVQKATLNSGVFVVRPTSPDLDTHFLRWTVQSRVFDDFIAFHYAGSTINHLYQNVFETFRFPCPIRAVQHEITKFLDFETTQIDQVKIKTLTFIDLLRELRSSLITAAVTGSIDIDSQRRGDSTVRRIEHADELGNT